MALLGAGVVVGVGHERGGWHTGDPGDVLDHGPRRFVERRGTAQALIELQQHQKPKLGRSAFGQPLSKEQFIVGGRERGVQIVDTEDTLETRIGGVLEAGHGAPGCQRSASLASRSLIAGIANSARYPDPSGHTGFLWQAAQERHAAHADGLPRALPRRPRPPGAVAAAYVARVSLRARRSGGRSALTAAALRTRP